jgi:hypothetical protein
MPGPFIPGPFIPGPFMEVRVMSSFDFGFEEYFADRGDFVDLVEV